MAAGQLPGWRDSSVIEELATKAGGAASRYQHHRKAGNHSMSFSPWNPSMRQRAETGASGELAEKHSSNQPGGG